MQVLVAFYFLEAGCFLLLAPWSRLWTQRVVLRSPEALQHLLASSHFRGFVAGLGVLHVLAAIRELRRTHGEAAV